MILNVNIKGEGILKDLEKIERLEKELTSALWDLKDKLVVEATEDDAPAASDDTTQSHQ